MAAKKGQGDGGAPFDPSTILGPIEDIFGAFFKREARGADRRIELSLSLEEAASGCKKAVDFARGARCMRCGGDGGEPGSVTHSCYVCGGSGVRAVQGEGDAPCARCRGTRKIHLVPCAACGGGRLVMRPKTITVTVPAGVEAGQVLRLSQQGDEAAREGSPGDLLLVVMVQPHPRLRRDGADLLVEVAIDAETARSGGRVAVPILGGERMIEVARGTEDGHRVVLRGHGAMRLGAEPVPIPELHADPYRAVDVSAHRGDQIVTFRVEADLPTEQEAPPARGPSRVAWAISLGLTLTAAALLALATGR
jgi:molecular chaperone DnaJ